MKVNLNVRDVIEAIKIHPLFLREESVMVFLFSKNAAVLERGITTDISTIVPSIIIVLSDRDSILISIAGMIFCQVMISKEDFFLKFILVRSMRYHLCEGQAPIFSINSKTSKVSFLSKRYGEVTKKIIKEEANIWVKK